MFSFHAIIFSNSSDISEKIHAPIGKAINQLYPDVSEDDFKCLEGSMCESILDMIAFSIEQDLDECGPEEVIDAIFNINIDNQKSDSWSGDTESISVCGMKVYLNVNRES